MEQILEQIAQSLFASKNEIWPDARSHYTEAWSLFEQQKSHADKNLSALLALTDLASRGSSGGWDYLGEAKELLRAICSRQNYTSGAMSTLLS